MSDEGAGHAAHVNGEGLAGEETLLDVLTGEAVRSIPKTRLVQKVLR